MSAVCALFESELSVAGGSSRALLALLTGRDGCDRLRRELRPAFIGTSYRTIVHGGENGADSESGGGNCRNLRCGTPLWLLRNEEVRRLHQHRVRVHWPVAEGRRHREVDRARFADVADDFANMHLTISYVFERAVVVQSSIERAQSNGSRERVVVKVALVDSDDRRSDVGRNDRVRAVPFVGEAGNGFDGGGCDRKDTEHVPSLLRGRQQVSPLIEVVFGDEIVRRLTIRIGAWIDLVVTGSNTPPLPTAQVHRFNATNGFRLRRERADVVIHRERVPDH
jgi:hypothetical protein